MASALHDSLAAYGGLPRLRARIDALPASARVTIAGYTALGAPIHAVEIGPAAAPRTTAIVAGLHALEWIGVEVALTLIERLAARPPADRRALAFPLINVDGFAAVEADLAAGRRRFRRWNARGVDLNRNWPTHFAGARRSGAAPRSEPEIAAVAAALDGAHRDAPLDRALSLHSFGRMILVPWGGRLGRPAAHARLRAAALAVQRRMAEPYRIRQVSHWLPGARARGLEIDDLHARYGALALLVECTRGGVLGRWRAAEATQPFRWYNPPAPGVHAAGIADAVEPFVRGV
jgi:predicted deacylase